MNILVNSKVKTPMGEGIVQGALSMLDERSLRSARVIIRLPVNDETRPHLGESLTPRASASGLWVFSEVDLL